MKCCNPHPPPCHGRRCPRTPHTPRAARPAPPAPRPGRREETRAALRTAASAPLPPPSCQGPPRPGRAAPPGPHPAPASARPPRWQGTRGGSVEVPFLWAWYTARAGVKSLPQNRPKPNKPQSAQEPPPPTGKFPC